MSKTRQRRGGVPPANEVRRRVAVPSLDAITERLVLAVISLFIATSRSRVPQESTRLCRTLAEAGRVGIPVNGVLQDPPFPDLPEGPWPTHTWALKELGLTQAGLSEEFELLRHLQGEQAHLDPERVEKFVPRELWSVVALMIEEGPGAAAARAERGLWLYSRGSVPANKRRPASRRSAGSVRDQRSAHGRLFRMIVRLAERGLPHPGLEQWTAVPDIELPPRLAEAPRDVVAPRPEQLRAAWRKLNEDVRIALGVPDGGSELDHVRSMSVTALAHSGAFRALRDRAVFMAMVLTGARITAMAQLRRSDFIRGYHGPGPDHLVCAALRTRPGKRLPADEVRLKPLPLEAAAIIEVYLLFLDRVCVTRRRWFRGVERSEAPADPPLFVSDQVNWRPFNQFGIRKLLSGAPPDKNGGGGRDALIRNPHAVNEELSEAERRRVGYKPRAIRAATMQLAERAGRTWNEEHPGHGGEPLPEPKLYGHALLDHKAAGDGLRLLYGDWDARSRIELLSGRATHGIWRLLTTSEGSRKRPNVELIRHTAAKLRAVEGQIAYLRARREQLNRAVPSTPPPRRVVPPPALAGGGIEGVDDE